MGREVPSDPNIKANWVFVALEGQGVVMSNYAISSGRADRLFEMNDWARENLKSRYSFDYKRITTGETGPYGPIHKFVYGIFFKGVRDAMMFKLVWGGQ